MSIADAFSLAGKTALITGCKRGIGKGMAIALAEAGADIVGVSASLESENSEVEKAVRGLGRKFRGYACDFADRQALLGFIDTVNRQHPVIDILVNNAGTIMRAPAAEHPDDYWDKVIEVNLSAQFVLSREIGKGMLERGRGKRGRRMRVEHEVIVGVMQMNRAVNHETRGVDVGRALEHLAVLVDLDQVGRGHLLVEQAETMHQKRVIGARHARGDVIPDGVVPAEQMGQAEHRREIDPHLPFGRAGLDRAFGAGEIICCYFAHNLLRI